MKEIIEVSDISKVEPKFETWYKYYDDIYISVIHKDISKRKSYLRIKSSNDYKSKSDSKMCFWHSNWQYSRIEEQYGYNKSGVKTYEITKSYLDEYHRIDSVVDNVAIEFQHSLNVSLNEMDSRYKAHKALGYIPYLVLDFTDFSKYETLQKFQNFNLNKLEYYKRFANEDLVLFLKKINKWSNSDYFINGNLFIDFSDCIIRMTPKLVKGNISYTQDFFLFNINNLELEIEKELQKEKDIEIQKEKGRKEFELQEKQKELNRYLNKVEKNIEQLKLGTDYLFYRKCLIHPIIKKKIEGLVGIEMVTYDVHNQRNGSLIKKSHIYSFFQRQNSDPILELQYTTHTNVVIKEYEYLFSEIKMFKKLSDYELMVLEFTCQPGQKVKLKSKKHEIAQGILHSTDYPAITYYDTNENLLSKEYYLLNKKMSKETKDSLSDFFEVGIWLGNEHENEFRKYVNDISDNDRFGLITGICQNYIPQNVFDSYYQDKKEGVR